MEFPSFFGTYYDTVVVIMIAASGNNQFLTITSQSEKEDWLSSMQSLPFSCCRFCLGGAIASSLFIFVAIWMTVL
jgi:hypothetical protein